MAVQLSLKDKLLAKFGPEPVAGEDKHGASILQSALANMKLYEDDGEVSIIPLPQQDTRNSLGMFFLSPSTGRLAIGSAGAAMHEENLDHAGVTHVVNLCQQVRNMFPGKYKYLKVSDLKDDGSSESTDALKSCLDECLDFIHTALSVGGTVLVHCYQGKSRSSAICCAYMLKHYPNEYPTMNDALDTIREKRPIAAPAVNFVPILNSMAQSSTKEGTATAGGVTTSTLGSSPSIAKLQVNRV